MGFRSMTFNQCLIHVQATEEEQDVEQTPPAGPLRLAAGFAEYVPAACRGGAPLPLQHQARCAVRERLGALRRLPEGVHRLPLPTAVKNYLDLQEL